MPAGAAARGVGLLAAPLPRFTSFQRVTPRSYALLQPTGTTYRAPERTATSAAGRSAALPRERPEGAPLRPSGPLCSPGEGKEATRVKDPEPPAGVRPPAALPASGAAPGAARQSPAAAARSAPPARAHLRPRRVSGRPRPQLFPFPAVSTPPPRPAAPHAAAEAAGPLAPQTMGPALTSTTAKRSSSSPGSGMGSLRGTLCALNSVCCESTLPAFPMAAAAAAAPPRCCAPRARPLARRAAARHGSPPSPSPRGGLAPAPAPARRRLPRMPPRGPHKAHSALPARGALGLVVPPPACGREGGEEGARAGAGAGAGRPDLHLAAPAAGGSAGQLALGGPLPSGLRRDGGGRSTSPPGAAPLCTFKVSTTKR